MRATVVVHPWWLRGRGMEEDTEGADGDLLLDGRYRVGAVVDDDGRRRLRRGFDVVLLREVTIIDVGAPWHREADTGEVVRWLEPSCRLRCPGIAELLDGGFDTGSLFFVVSGRCAESLDGVLRRCGRLPPAVVVDLGARLADTLAALHEQGAVHGALTPAQVLLDDTGPRVIELGLSRGITRWTGRRPPSRYCPSPRRGREPVPADDVLALGRLLRVAGARSHRVPSGLAPLLQEMTNPAADARPSMRAVAAVLADERSGAVVLPAARARRARLTGLVLAGAAVVVAVVVVPRPAPTGLAPVRLPAASPTVTGPSPPRRGIVSGPEATAEVPAPPQLAVLTSSRSEPPPVRDAPAAATRGAGRHDAALPTAADAHAGGVRSAGVPARTVDGSDPDPVADPDGGGGSGSGNRSAAASTDSAARAGKREHTRDAETSGDRGTSDVGREKDGPHDGRSHDGGGGSHDNGEGSRSDGRGSPGRASHGGGSRSGGRGSHDRGGGAHSGGASGSQ
jgi:eukaryotic-like serine/threonine-protein kinase